MTLKSSNYEWSGSSNFDYSDEDKYRDSVRDVIEWEIEDALFRIFNDLADNNGFWESKVTFEEFHETWHLGGWFGEIRDCAIEVFKDNGIDFLNDKLTWEETV